MRPKSSSAKKPAEQVVIRSLVLNGEASLIIYDPATAAGLQAKQTYAIARSDRLVSAELDQRSVPTKIIENIARLFRPLL